MSDYRELRAVLVAEKYQNSFTSANIARIKKQSSPQEFSLEHLQNLHREIFKDFPQAWFAKDAADFFVDLPPEYIEFTPGAFRQPSVKYNPWSKLRTYEEKRSIYTYYSCADKEDFAKVSTLLSSLDIEALRVAPVSEKIKTVVEVYEELDFLHPFMDGNSRTNRLFVLQLADAIELPLTWDKVSRQDLYAARDLNLLLKSKGYYADTEVRGYIYEGLDFLREQGYLGLQNLLEITQSFSPDSQASFSIEKRVDAARINVVELLQPGREKELNSFLNEAVLNADVGSLNTVALQANLLLASLDGDPQSERLLIEHAGIEIHSFTNEEKEKIKIQAEIWRSEINQALEEGENRALELKCIKNTAIPVNEPIKRYDEIDSPDLM